MLPGPPQILTCPFCGGHKEVMSLISGNTFQLTLWSDARVDNPMLPRVSQIQKCPHCGKYYFFNDSKPEYAEDGYSGELGNLNFDELCEAKHQLDVPGLDKGRLVTLDMMLVWAYNDLSRYFGQTSTQGQTDIYNSIVDELLSPRLVDMIDPLFHVELLRENGRFDEAVEELQSIPSGEHDWIVDAMKSHIADEDTKPFMLICHGNKLEL